MACQRTYTFEKRYSAFYHTANSRIGRKYQRAAESKVVAKKSCNTALALRARPIRARPVQHLNKAISNLAASQIYPLQQLHSLAASDIRNQRQHPSMAARSSIAIIGAGSVGSAIAYSLLLRQVVADIILVDIDQKLCQAQVQDLSDATFLSNVRIRQGGVAEAAKADIIIITAGAKQRPGDTRLDLIDRNFKVLKSILGSLQPIRKDAILLIVANPVDVLTLFAQRLSGLPKSQVFGSGTLLDSTRLTNILAGKLKVNFLKNDSLACDVKLTSLGCRLLDSFFRHWRAWRFSMCT